MPVTRTGTFTREGAFGVEDGTSFERETANTNNMNNEDRTPFPFLFSPSDHYCYNPFYPLCQAEQKEKREAKLSLTGMRNIIKVLYPATRKKKRGKGDKSKSVYV